MMANCDGLKKVWAESFKQTVADGTNVLRMVVINGDKLHVYAGNDKDNRITSQRLETPSKEAEPTE